MRALRRSGLRLLSLLLGLGLGSGAAASEHSHALHLGVVPFVQPSLIFKRFGPLRDLLAERLGQPVRLGTAATYEAFERRSAEHRYHILWTAPHFAVHAADSGAYRVLAVWREPVVGVLAVHNDSPVQTVAELAGKTIATPPRRSVVTMAMRDHLVGLGLDDAHAPTYRPQSGHMTSRARLLGGDVDAAVFGRNVLADGQQKGLPLRVLAQAPEMPGAAVLVSRRLDPAVQEAIREQLLQLEHSEQGRAALAATRMPGYRAADLDDLAPVRPYAGGGTP